MYKRLLCALFFLAAASAAYAQQFVAKTGSEGYYRVSSRVQFGSFTFRDTLTWHFKVTGTTDSSLRLTCTLLNANSKIDQMVFNTADSLKCMPVSSRSLEMLSLLNQPFSYTYNKRTGVLQKDLVRIHEQNTAAWKTQKATADVMKNNTTAFLNAECNLLFPMLPTSLNGLPATWMAPDSSLRYHLASRNAQTVAYTAIQGKPVPGYKADNNWQCRFNTTTGMLINGGFKSVMTRDTATKPEMEQEVNITLVKEADVKRTPLSNDFKTMIGQLVFSDALTDGLTPTLDSAKLDAYFKKYDPIFGQYGFYKLIKLDAVQRSNIAQNYKIYHKMLWETPNALLAGSNIHLINKVHSADDHTADSVFETAVYLSKYRSGLRDWVQESFSQAFIPLSAEQERKELKEDGDYTDQEIDEIIANTARRRQTSIKLLDKLVHDGDSTMLKEVYPMHLWVQAQEHAGNKDSVLKIAGELATMANSKQYSNPHRYGLLLYKQLVAQGSTKAANTLIDQHIAAMEKAAADTSNKGDRRYADQNMLAYAYKLKSEAVEKTDAKASMAYLAKAAAYSPKNNREKVRTSFYDQAFLESKENYRAEFAEALIKQGKGQQGMKVLAQQLQTDPAIFSELQASFTKGFPDLDFYDFFHNVVTKSWKTAPSFNLPAADGQFTYKLEDYRGKWLLIDFWGTWCAPCREEMPQINRFAQKIKDRKDIAFLSIACYDQAEAVLKYFAANNFKLPAAMSDNKIQNTYAVPGYPAKFLISPTGTVLHIGYGQDWEKAVDDFTGLQPKKEETNIIKQKD